MSISHKKRRDHAHRSKLISIQGNKCCYCERTLLHPQVVLESGRVHPRAATLEHLQRKTDGGTGHLDNKAVACYECNTSRGPTDWLTYKSMKMGEIVV